MVSLYHAYTTPAGRGTAAFVQIEGEKGSSALCTDNQGFAQFVKETQVSASAPYHVEAPVVEATFERGGEILIRPMWTIRAQGRVVTASWWDLQTPLVGPPTAHPRIVFTVLVFADQASIELDGREVEGEPYPRDAWVKNLGRPMSSCVFALAETMVRESRYAAESGRASFGVVPLGRQTCWTSFPRWFIGGPGLGSF